MDSLKVWMRQQSNSLVYSDSGDWQAKATTPVTSIAERPVQQWTYTRFFFIVPLMEYAIDLTSHRVIVRKIPSFFITILYTLLAAVAFAGFGVGAGCGWWTFLVAALGAGMGFLAAYRMLPVRTWITTHQDINAIHYGAQAASFGVGMYLFVFICFYGGGLLASNGDISQAVFWGLTAVVCVAYMRTIFRQTVIELTVTGRVDESEFSFPVDPFDMEHIREKLLENKLALDYGTELHHSNVSTSSTAKTVGGYQGLGEDEDI